MKHLILSLFLALSASAFANPLYYSRCDSTEWVNSHASCTPGNDANNGLSPDTPKLTPPTSFTSGVTYRFNRAGAWDIWNRVLIGNRQDITFEAYTPASCVGDCLTRKPMIGAALTQNSNTCPNNHFWFSGTSARITVRGFHMIGKQTPTTITPVLSGGLGCSSARGVYYYGDAVGANSAHRLEDNIIERTSMAVQVAATNAVGASANRNLRITGNTILHAAGNGILGGGPGMLIEGNVFDGNAWEHEVPAALGKDAHHLYLSGGDVTGGGAGLSQSNSGIVVRFNSFLRHNRLPGATTSTCSSTPVVGHGNMPDLTIEYNLVYETSATGGCYALVMDGNTSTSETPQKFDRLRLRGNVISVPNAFVLLGCSACPDAIIENNTLVSPGSTSDVQAIVLNTVGGSIQYQPARGDSAPGKVTIRNNSIYVDSSSGTARGSCIAYRYAEYSTPVPTAEDVIVNNVCVYGPNHPASARAFGLEGAGPSRFAAFSNNFVFKSGGTPVWSDAYSALSAFETAFGAKASANSQDDPNVSIPTLANGWSMTPGTGSPLIDAGHATRSSLTDVDRYLPAGVRRDIGSREANRTTQAPLGPTGARIQ